MRIKSHVRNMLIPVVKLLARSDVLRRYLRPFLQRNPTIKTKLLRMVFSQHASAASLHLHNEEPAELPDMMTEAVRDDDYLSVYGGLSPQARKIYRLMYNN